MRDLAFDQAAHRLDAAHHAIIQKEHEYKKFANSQLDQYRKLFQRKEDLASFELNDPHWLKKQRPIGADGDFSAYGPSSVVTFDGEKLRTPKEIELRTRKQRDDLGRQLDEKRTRQDHERNVNSNHSAEFLAQQARLDAIDRATEDLQKATTLATRRYNEALLATQEDHKRRFREQEQADAAAHVNNVRNGALLNEVSVHARDWRGLSPAQLDAVYAQRDQQVHERANARLQERQEDYVWDNYFRNVENQVKKELLALEEERAAVRRNLDALNQKMALERKDREEVELIMKNGAQPTPEWFDKFESDPR
ncbi:RIB43A-like with coiled-coils protein 2 isoform X2 [Paramacrobiotus metropolitanus]|nr:RIB43A-like with coiled-coils protein 2 isoform X2 [Paramacrobiotus metropolitanus]XP_055348456.1 RIB43A-like with coiled-coils protein 2 isoform X2 [Paramacrobiotus metropolitanus]